MEHINPNNDNNAQHEYPEQGPLSSDNDNQIQINPDTALENNTAPKNKQNGAEDQVSNIMTKKNRNSNSKKVKTTFSSASGVSPYDAKNPNSHTHQDAKPLDEAQRAAYRGIVTKYFGKVEPFPNIEKEKDVACAGFHRRIGSLIAVVTSWPAAHDVCHHDLLDPIVILDDPELLKEIRDCRDGNVLAVDNVCPIMVERLDLYILENGIPLPLWISEGEPLEMSIIDETDWGCNPGIAA